ncbi:MAG: hypothetical protein IT453_09015 [Planctomycetes bacterium]|nr:hypothetical protein [Planctomycetota bacterium]
MASPVERAERAEERLVEPLGHARRMRELVRSAARERLPHALLFTGASGIGKYLSARWLACALLCTADDVEARPCGACPGCRQFVTANHLDVYAIDEEGERIPLKKIAYRPGHDEAETIEAERFLGTRASAGGWRVVLVRDAERMTDEAQNAMLKMLEEPGRKALWLLTTSRPQALLSTVRSRCIAVPFDALSAEDCATVLARHGYAPADAKALAVWGHGSPGRSLALAERSAGDLRALLGGVFTGAAAPLDASRALMQVEGEFSGSTPLQQARDRARTVLELALEIAGDALRLSSGVPLERLVHVDLLAGLPGGFLAAQAPRLARKLEGLLETRADIDKNLDPQSVLDRACLTLAP